MNNFYSSIYKAFIYAGLIAFIIGFLTVSKTSLGAYIAGYSVLIFAILMILVILFSNIIKTGQTSSSLIYYILFTSGPFLLILGIMCFVLYLLINYKNNIIDGKVSPSYSSFSNIIILLLFIQFYMVYTNINSEKFEATGKISKVSVSIIYLLSVITSICSIILYTILKYYSTDGFSKMNL